MRTWWNEYLNLKSTSGDLKFPNIGKVVKASLTLSHGSADVERGFSRSARILTDDKASMDLRMLNARLNVQDAMRDYDNKPELVPMTRELMALAKSASASYKALLEKKKQEKEMAKMQKEEEEVVKMLEAKRQQKVQKTKQFVDKLQNDLQKAKEKQEYKRKAGEKVFEEANKRLKRALDKNDLEDAKMAQVMLQGVKVAHEEVNVMQKEYDNIQKCLDKKRSNLITSLFKKQ